MSKLPVLGSVFVALLLATGCAAEPTSDELGSDEVSQTDDELSSYSECTLSRSQILRSVSGGRKRAIERGFRWLDAGVSYSQSRSYEGYRTDCSGFVSMCWELEESYSTSTFYAGDGDSNLLRTYDELLPGDALVKDGHMVLFLGWKDSASACVLEQASTDNDMEFRARTTSSLRSQRYKALRADKFY